MEPIIRANAIDCKYFILQFYYVPVSHNQDGKILMLSDPIGKNSLHVDVFLEPKIGQFFIRYGTCSYEKNST